MLVDQAPRHASVAAVIAGDVAEHGFASLKAPIVQVTALDATVPYSEPLEAYVLPDEEKVVGAVQQVLGRRRRGVAVAGAAMPRSTERRLAPARDDVADPAASRSGSGSSSAPTRSTA